MKIFTAPECPNIVAKFFVLGLLAAVNGVSINSTPTLKECDLQARGPGLLAKQDAAVKDFANIFLEQKNPKKAWDKYVPGKWIEHNPNGLSGRENAIKFLTALFDSTPNLTITNLTAYAGGGFGHLHFREFVRGEGEGDLDQVVMDRLRFEGTCFVEHWDVAQAVTGNEANPEAWF